MILCGFQGVGKTTYGKNLAQLVGASFIDTDLEVEKIVNCSVRDFFKQEGESEFRKIETSVIQTLSQIDNAVIALGGGTLLSKHCQTLVKPLGICVCLFSRNSLENAKQKEMPLYAKGDLELSFQERMKSYREMSCIWVPTEQENVESILEELWHGY